MKRVSKLENITLKIRLLSFRLIAKVFVSVLLLLAILFSQSACFEEPIMLNKQDKKLIDSLYNAERKARMVELDSLCDLHFDGRVQGAVDSIMEKRLEEIRRLKGVGGTKLNLNSEK